MKILILTVFVSIFSAQTYAFDLNCEFLREKVGERITEIPLKKIDHKSDFFKEAYILVDGEVEADAAFIKDTLVLTLGKRSSDYGARATVTNFTKGSGFYASTYIRVNNINYTLGCR